MTGDEDRLLTIVLDGEFDDLFRPYFNNIYRGLGSEPPTELERNIVPHTQVWTFTRPIDQIQAGDRLFDSFAPEIKAVWFSFRCTHPNCDGTEVCC